MNPNETKGNAATATPVYRLQDALDGRMGSSADSVLERLFTFQPPKGNQPDQYREIREAAKVFAKVIHHNCPEGSDRSTAIRLVREAVMVANASIALDGAEYRT